MRLSKEHVEIISAKEEAGFVWLSHLSAKAQMRFRDRTKRGFDKFVKVKGLTFLTKEVAEFLESTSRKATEPRMKVSEQMKVAEDLVARMSVDKSKAAHTIELLHEIVVQFVLSMHDGHKVTRWQIEDNKVTIDGHELHLGAEAIDLLMAIIRGDRQNGVPVPLLH